MQALGDRVYPVLACGTCFNLTGWLSPQGDCDACVRRRQVRAAFSDPHGGWVSLPEVPEAAAERSPGPSLRERLSPHGRRVHRVECWLRHVEPDDTGPIEPEEGYELEVALRDEVVLTDGTGMLVRFTTATHRFGGGDWVPLAGTRASRAALAFPTEFAAALAVECLVEAWGDYQEVVAGFNRSAWAAASERRRADEAARAEQEAALGEQQHTADLLREER